jgi:uncharacterized repeat protein (TIGR01451 family)
VLAENTYSGLLRNIAEISDDYNEYGVKDRDSITDNVDINHYNPPTNNSEYQEDDDDYELLVLAGGEFDLALTKFITRVESLGKETTYDREPRPAMPSGGFDGDLDYIFPVDKEANPVLVANGDTVIYTIRIYNEGDIDGYAEEIKDNIPEGLEYLPEHEINTKYRWAMYYRVNGELVGTSDISLATEIRTDYLSKEQEESTGRNNKIRALDLTRAISTTAPLNPDYRDVEIAFKVIEPEGQYYSNGSRIIKNTAEISADYNEEGVPDRDSTPDNDVDGEDDIDYEYLYVKYFDLALIKWVSRAIVTVDGQTTTTEYDMPSDDPGSEFVVKVDIDRRRLNTTIVDFVYTIKIVNEGEIAGYATEIKDYIPAGLEFREEDNPLWERVGDNVVRTRALENTLLQPAKYENNARQPDGNFNRGTIINPEESTATIDITLRWINGGDNIGLKENIAEISEDYNDHGSRDWDSTPDNRDPNEDDQDFALVLLGIRTGEALIYMPAIGMILTTLLAGLYLIKRYVLI